VKQGKLLILKERYWHFSPEVSPFKMEKIGLILKEDIETRSIHVLWSTNSFSKYKLWYLEEYYEFSS